jgi:hypothetical protein
LVSVLDSVSAEQRFAVRRSLASLATWVANEPWLTVDVVLVIRGCCYAWWSSGDVTVGCRFASCCACS